MDLTQLIEAHTSFGQSAAGNVEHIAHHLDVDTRRRWARVDQAGFDAAWYDNGIALLAVI